MIRILTLIAGLLGGAALSQFPEFSQQYLQRLAGAVDELDRVVEDFDASAAGVGMSRDQALAALSDGEFQKARQTDMIRTIGRAERLGADLAALRDASPVERALQPWRFTDGEIARAAWDDFRPAVPVTPTGAGFAGTGFIGGMAVTGPILWGLAWLLRRRRRRKVSRPDRAGTLSPRKEPPPLRPEAEHGPRPGLPVGWMARTNSTPHKVVQAGASTQIAVLSLEPEAVETGQAGRAFDMVLVCLEGEGEVRIDEELRSLRPGELVTIPAGMEHEIRNTRPDEPLRLFAVEPRSALAPRAEGRRERA